MDDAYYLMDALPQMKAVWGYSIPGETGVLTIDNNCIVQRSQLGRAWGFFSCRFPNQQPPTNKWVINTRPWQRIFSSPRFIVNWTKLHSKVWRKLIHNAPYANTRLCLLRYRKQTRYGHAAEMVTAKKSQKLLKTANVWLMQQGLSVLYRF